MKKNFKLLLLTLIMGGGFFASEAMALDQDGYGVYQIRTAQDWNTFCEMSQTRENFTTLHADLKADITVEGNNMIGKEGKPFNGTFDGQGHTITINYNLNEERVAPFRRLNGGKVKNLIVMGTITTTSKLASGVVGGIWQSGKIENCVSYVTINDNSGLDNNGNPTGNPTDATHGGICGSFEDTNTLLGISVTNCAFLGKIDAPNRKGSGGIVGWTNHGTISNCYVGGVLNLATGQDNNIICRDNNSPTVSNCYYTDLQNMNGHDGASSIALNALKSALGDDWSEIYSGAAPLPNQFVPTKNSDNYYELSTASHMRQFAELVNNSNNSANAKMMNDINLSNIWTPIGQSSHHFTGQFDGQYHAINYLDLSSNGGYDNQGLFGNISGNAVIENLTMGATCTIKGKEHVAGFVGRASQCTISNCVNKATIEASDKHASGIIATIDDPVTINNCTNYGNIKGGTSAGIVARVWNRAATSTINNCINEGRVEGSGNEIGGIVAAINVSINISNCTNKATVSGGQRIGGILGATWVSSPDTEITNCINKGEIIGEKYLGGILGRNEDQVTVQNCGNEGNISGNGDYTDGTNAGGIVGCSVTNISILNCYNTANVTGKKENAGICAWMGSSESIIKNCFSIGTVKNTVADTDTNNPSKPLWRKGDLSDGNATNNYFLYEIINYEDSYVEGNQGIQITGNQLTCGELCYKLNDNTDVWHQSIGTDTYPVPFSDGHLVVHNTGNLYNNHFTDAGYVNITSPADLVAFANAVNKANYYNVQAKLSNNLDMSSQSSNFPCIGSEAHPFCGVFDGQNHIISNLDLDLDQNGVGLFGTITGPKSDDHSTQTIIKNITIDNTCSFKGNQGVAGIAGRCVVNGNNPCGVQFQQCGNEASATATVSNAGGILGVNIYYQQNYNYVRMTLVNCYNTGAIKGHECGGISGWLGDNQVTLTNCYSTGTVTETVDGGNYDAFCRWNNSAYSVTNCYSLYNSERLNYQPQPNITDSSTPEENFQNGTVFASLHNYSDNGVDGTVWHMTFSGTPHPVLAGPVEFKDDFNNIIDADNEADVIIYRNFVQNNWNTVCLPFGMTDNQIATVFGEGTKVAALTGCEGTTLKFTTTAGIIEAGKPYLIYPTKENFSEFTINGVDIAGSTTTGIVQGGLTFMGTLQPTEVYAATDYGMTSGNTIKKANNGTIKGFRAFFRETPSGARATNFVIDDETTTAIADDLIIDNARQNSSSKIYDLSGRQIKSGQLNKGLYIVNGKKYLK